MDRLRALLRAETVGDPSANDGVGPAAAAHFSAAHVALVEGWHRAAAASEGGAPERLGVGGWSLLWTWPGEDRTLTPLVLVSHMDVVPAGDHSAWTHPPFEASVFPDPTAQGGADHVWARGSVDAKGTAAAALEAIEALLALRNDDAWQPRRDVLLLVGHDEETGGRRGAAQVAQLLRQRYPRGLGAVIDEGGVVLDAGIQGLASGPVALVGTSEKGWADVIVSATGGGGHASMPPRGCGLASTPTGAVGALAARVARAGGGTLRLTAPVEDMLMTLGASRRAPAIVSLALTLARWPIVGRLLARAVAASGAAAAAVVSDTLTVTEMTAGTGENVIPDTARAVVSSRLLPGTTGQDVLNLVRGLARGLELDVSLAKEPWHPAAPVTSSDGAPFQLLAKAAQAALGDDVLVAPFLLVAKTDSRHLADQTRHVLRFAPWRMPTQMDIQSRVHGVDERLAIADFHAGVHFYQRLIIALSTGVWENNVTEDEL